MHIFHKWSEWVAVEIYQRYSGCSYMWTGFELVAECSICFKTKKAHGIGNYTESQKYLLAPTNINGDKE